MVSKHMQLPDKLVYNLDVGVCGGGGEDLKPPVAAAEENQLVCPRRVHTERGAGCQVAHMSRVYQASRGWKRGNK